MYAPALNAAWEDTRGLVTHLALEFHRRHGGDRNDIVAEAQTLFIDACFRYDRSRNSRFDKWAAFRIWKGLLDYVRRRARRRAQESPIDCDTLPQRRGSPFWLVDFLDELSEDARALVGIVIGETPPEVRTHAVAARRNGGGHATYPNTPGRIRAAVIEFLEDIGWTPERIVQAFEDVRNAL